MSDTVLNRYFLSAHTPLGFVSRLGALCNHQRFERVLLVKGGSESMRSRLIERIAAAAQDMGFEVTRIAGASAGKTEAAFWQNAAVIDSALPHPIEPQYPSVVEEVLWLGDCMEDKKLILRRNEIIALKTSERELLEQSRRFLSAADALLGDNRRMAREGLDEEKISRQAKRLAQKLFKGSGFCETPCILSDCFGALQSCIKLPDGMRVISLQDENGCCAPLLLRELFSAARFAGCKVMAGYSPFAPYERLEQLILPELSLAFLTENERLPLPCEPDRVIHSRRFTDKAQLSRFKSRISFNKKAARQMLNRSRELWLEAQEIGQSADRLYEDALNARSFEICCEKAVKLL